MAASSSVHLHRIIIPHYNSVWKYLVNIRSETWLKLFWEYINGKLFAVYWGGCLAFKLLSVLGEIESCGEANLHTLKRAINIDMK
jgi:hypothetical protein